MKKKTPKSVKQVWWQYRYVFKGILSSVRNTLIYLRDRNGTATNGEKFMLDLVIKNLSIMIKKEKEMRELSFDYYKRERKGSKK
jgi:hypothetical protein